MQAKRNSNETQIKRNKEKYSVTMTPSIQEQGSEIAQRKGMSLSMLIEQLLRREIEEDDRARNEVRAAANARRR